MQGFSVYVANRSLYTERLLDRSEKTRSRTLVTCEQVGVSVSDVPSRHLAKCHAHKSIPPDWVPGRQKSLVPRIRKHITKWRSVIWRLVIGRQGLDLSRGLQGCDVV